MGAAGRRRHGADLGVLVRQQDLLHRLFLHPVAVQVDGVQDALGKVWLLGRRQLRHQEVRAQSSNSETKVSASGPAAR